MALRRRSPEPTRLRRLVIGSVLVAFGLGVIFGALAGRLPRPGLAGRAANRTSGVPVDFLADPIPGHPAPQPFTPSEGDSIPGDGTAIAPPDYPIKGNGRSGIYHMPGGFAYERTVATVCFRTAEAAEAAGLRASKS
jgi:hypothetical protein